MTALQALPHVLPQEDEEAAASIVPALEADGIELRPGVDIQSARHGAEAEAGDGPSASATAARSAPRSCSWR